MDLWSKFADWLKENPWVTILGFLLTLIGVILSVIFYIKSRRAKEPCYAIRSTNLIQDFTGRFEKLEIKYADEQITNFTATKVAFWNNGKATINSGDIASGDPLMIRVKNGCKILDPSVLHPKKDNNPNRFKIVPSEDGSHVLIQFDYLDKGQGGVIQLLHTGKSSDDVEVCGYIKGDGKPKFRSFSIAEALLPMKLGTYFFHLSWRRIYAVLLFAISVAIIVSSLFSTGGDVPSTIPGKIIMYIMILVMFWGTGFYLIKRHVPKGLDEIFFEEISKSLK